MLTQSLAFGLLACVTYMTIRLFRHVERMLRIFGDMPGPKRHWLYGTIHHIPRGTPSRMIAYGLEMVNKYKYYYFHWFSCLQPVMMVCHPTTMKTIMRTSEPKPLGYFGTYRYGLPWLGLGLITSGGQLWARSRRLLTSAFHFEILKPYIDVYNESGNKLIETLGKLADSEEKFDIFTYASKSTLEVILRCAFSCNEDIQKDKGGKNPYIEAIAGIADGWLYRVENIWLYPDWIYYLTPMGRKFKQQCDYVHQVAEEIISKRRKTLEEKEGKTDRKYLDFLDILLTAKDENGIGLTPLEIRNEVDTFLFAGHDTTSAAISWIMYNLAKHPEYQQKCQEEIDGILRDRETDDITWDDLHKMPYLAMCIKEGLRDGSPVPLIQREFTNDFEMDGHKFPAGTIVTLNIYGLHHNEHVWEKPMEFIPERFSKENAANMDPYQYVPFSAGPRNCIGQNLAQAEIKVVIAKLLRKYWFEVDPTHEVKRKIAAVMRTENGIMMYVKRR